jgi:two-component system cell cycle sensor histidine kinase/response regulator CckA
MRRVENITGIVSLLVGFIILVVVLIIPLGYAVISYQYIAGSLATEVEINARIVTQVINANPRMWEFAGERLQQYLERRPKTGEPEIRRVFTSKDELVEESADKLYQPIMMRSAELFDAGIVVGRIEISRSLMPLIMKAGLLMLVMLPFGAGAFIVLHMVPLRALRRSENAVKKERDTAQKYLDVAGVMLVAIDAGQKVTMINRKGCEITGLPEHMIIGRNWIDSFVPEKNREEAKKIFLQLRDGMTRGTLVHAESLIKDATDNERLIAWNHTALTDDNGAFAGVLSSGEDITNQQQLENQLRHAQKLEAVGVLAGGIAHDFNNILTAIIGHSTLLHMQMRKDDSLQHSVEQILASSERASHLVKSLLAYSRKQIVDPKLVEVNDIVSGIKKMLSSLLREDIELKTVLSNNPLTIRVDPGQIEQVLMNLASNARDAMPEGGLLSIATGSTELDEGFSNVHGYGTPGAYALITVSDSGTGMSDQIKEKIFDPFFTTKEVGKGTGLGLAMAYGIIKQHKGYINVYSELGEGTTFKIYLPLAQVGTRDVKKIEFFHPAGGTETILIAEDDEAVRKMTATALREAGYDIIEARDGEEAIREVAECKKRVQLVILDVIMPKKNGRVVYDEIKKTQPDIKVVFMSGYTADILETKMMGGPNEHFLQKPMSPRILLKIVRDALDA